MRNSSILKCNFRSFSNDEIAGQVNSRRPNHGKLNGVLFLRLRKFGCAFLCLVLLRKSQMSASGRLYLPRSVLLVETVCGATSARMDFEQVQAALALDRLSFHSSAVRRYSFLSFSRLSSILPSTQLPFFCLAAGLARSAAFCSVRGLVFVDRGDLPRLLSCGMSSQKCSILIADE